MEVDLQPGAAADATEMRVDAGDVVAIIDACPEPGVVVAPPPDDAQADLPAVVETPKRTFGALLEALTTAEEFLADPNFDPATLLGDIRDKVDSIHLVEQRMERVAGYLRDLARPLAARASALTANRERLRAYVVNEMSLQSIERVPGHAFAVRLRDNSTASLKIRAAGPADKLAFPDFVIAERSYYWDGEKVKAALAAGTAPEGLPGELERGQWPEFIPNVPVQLERPKKPRKKKANA